MVARKTEKIIITGLDGVNMLGAFACGALFDAPKLNDGAAAWFCCGGADPNSDPPLGGAFCVAPNAKPDCSAGFEAVKLKDGCLSSAFGANSDPDDCPNPPAAGLDAPPAPNEKDGAAVAGFSSCFGAPPNENDGVAFGSDVPKSDPAGVGAGVSLGAPKEKLGAAALFSSGFGAPKPNPPDA